MCLRTAVVESLVLLLVCAASHAAAGAHADENGRIRMLWAGDDFHPITTDLVVATAGWARQFRLGDAASVRRSERGRERRWTGVLPADKGEAIAYEQSLEQRDGAVRLHLRVEARGDADFAGVFLFVHVPVRLFAGGRCELIDPDPNTQRTAAPMPTKLPEEHQFLHGRSAGLRIADRQGAKRLELALDRPLELTVQDGRKWKGDDYSAFFRVLPAKVRRGDAAELTLDLRLTAPRDERAARLALDASRRRYRLWGFGGNFCYGVDSPVTGHNLANIPMAYARVGVKLEQWEPLNDNDSAEEMNWAYYQKRDREGSEVRADFLLARRLAERKVPYIASVWRVPEFVTAQPGRGAAAHKRVCPREKWPELLECIGSYLLHAKRRYAAEPEMFSFNESDIGCFVLMTPQEHRDFIKACGAYLAKLGLKTKMLLGDCANADVTFVEPAMSDPEAMRHVGALAYHTWHKRPEHYRAWREVARRAKLPIIAAEVGPDAHAWRDRSFHLMHYFVNELRMYQEILLHAEAQALLEWEYTADYRMCEIEKGPDGKETVRPTPRFWMIRQLAIYTPRPAVALGTASDHDKVLFTAFRSEDGGRLALHVANCGGARKAMLTGLPGGLGELRATQTTWDAGPAELPPVHPRDGQLDLSLPQFSLLTLTSGG